jgi:glycerophosphoryl diester phosphodiesterase
MRFVAHRGYSAKFPGNTIPAFEAALRHPEHGRRLTGIELDIRATRDGRLAVFHDGVIKLACGDTPIEALAFEDLRAAVAARSPGTEVPVLEDVFACVSHRLELLVEIKDGGYEKARFFDALDGALRRYQPRGDVILHSFSAAIMEEALRRFMRPAVRFGALVRDAEALAAFPPELTAAMDFIHPHWQGLSQAGEVFRTVGKPLNVWTVNRLAELAVLKALACAPLIVAVMTDDLALMEQEPP